MTTSNRETQTTSDSKLIKGATSEVIQLAQEQGFRTHAPTNSGSNNEKMNALGLNVSPGRKPLNRKKRFTMRSLNASNLSHKALNCNLFLGPSFRMQQTLTELNANILGTWCSRTLSPSPPTRSAKMAFHYCDSKHKQGHGFGCWAR